MEREGGFTAPLFPDVLQSEEAWISLRGLRGSSGGESASIGEIDRERRGVVLDLMLVVSFSCAIEKNKM